jgi:predicted nucleic acid-binding protein
MSPKYFLDTNIFIYSFDSGSAEKQNRATDLIRKALGEGGGCISYQIVQEFLNVATRKFAVPLSAKDAVEYLTTVLHPLCEIFSSYNLYKEALEITERWQYSFYDSLVLASARAAGCHILYSEDLQHGQKLGDLTIINPFA